MRVLIISPFFHPDIGGVEAHLQKLLNFLNKKKIYSTIITYQPLNSSQKFNSETIKNKSKIIRVNWFGKNLFQKFDNYFPINFLYLFPGLFIKSIFYLTLTKDKIDVVHAHGFIAGAIAILLKFFFKKKIVLSTHAIYGLKKNKFKSKFFFLIAKYFNYILCVSELSKKELTKIGLEKKKMILYQNWVVLKKLKKNFKKLNFLNKKKINTNKKIILFVGRLFEKKGELVLLNAAKVMKDYNFVFIGNGWTKDIIKKESETAKNIYLFTSIGNEELSYFYKSSDIFASPVLYDEGFATVYLEALYYGLPVISCNRGSLPYFLDKKVSLLLKNTKQKNIINAIKTVDKKIQNKAYTKKKMYDYANSFFSEKNAEVILKTYEKTIAN
jgi:glycosyltransferase involved in cell wall biosynthesis